MYTNFITPAMIYFDNSSSTRIDYRIIRTINKNYKYYANYNSINHKMGKKVFRKVEKARKKISFLIGCKKEEIFFTSSSTESINIILKGFKNKDYIIATTKTEHSSVLKTLKNIKKKIIFIKCNNKGNYKLNNIDKQKKYFFCLSKVNGVTGCKYNFNSIRKIKTKKKIVFLDLTQSICKIKINNIKEIDFMCFSTSKIHGPKGISILYIKKKFIDKVKILIHGGGTKKIKEHIDLPLIKGAYKAIKIGLKDMKKNNKHISKIKNKFLYNAKKNKNIIINSVNSVPNIINFYVKNIDRVIIYKYTKNFCYTKNTSCEESIDNSNVLKNMGLCNEAIKNSIRISFSKYNNISEIKVFYRIINNLCKKYDNILII